LRVTARNLPLSRGLSSIAACAPSRLSSSHRCGRVGESAQWLGLPLSHSRSCTSATRS
jgi:hypothetical protein